MPRKPKRSENAEISFRSHYISDSSGACIFSEIFKIYACPLWFIPIDMFKSLFHLNFNFLVRNRRNLIYLSLIIHQDDTFKKPLLPFKWTVLVIIEV